MIICQKIRVSSFLFLVHIGLEDREGHKEGYTDKIFNPFDVGVIIDQGMNRRDQKNIPLDTGLMSMPGYDDQPRIRLLCTPHDDVGISKMMQSVERRYVHNFNRAYRRSGTLWEGRFKSCVVENETYLVELYRYIEMNEHVDLRGTIEEKNRGINRKTFEVEKERATNFSTG